MTQHHTQRTGTRRGGRDPALGGQTAATSTSSEPIAALAAPGAPLLLTVRQAATYLSVSRAHVYRLLQSGELHAVKSRTAIRVPFAELQRYVTQLIEEQA